MNTSDLLSHIDDEISRLHQVRNLLAGHGTGNASARVVRAGKPLLRKKRVLSAEARAKISAAQKKRWAKQKAGK